MMPAPFADVQNLSGLDNLAESALTLSDQALERFLKQSHLTNARHVWRDLVQRAGREAWSCRDFLALLVTEEMAHRRASRWTHFPFLKTIEEFDFSHQSVVRRSSLDSALAPDFVTSGRSLILSGKPGRGKTHLAIAVAYRAIQNGFDARFVTAAELIDDLAATFRARRFTEALAAYTHPAVLVVDEIDYLIYDVDAANMLSRVVHDRYLHKRSMIFTANKPLTDWGRVLHDDDLASAIVDRLLERGQALRLDGPSMRTRHVAHDPTPPDAPDHWTRIPGNEAAESPRRRRAQPRDQARQQPGEAADLRRRPEADQGPSTREEQHQYGVLHHQQRKDRRPIQTAGTERGTTFSMQRALRFTVLEFLYMKRQSEPEKPSVFPMELAELVGVPCEQLEFTMWFLLQKGLVQRTDHSNLAITAAGVEYLEQNDEGGITQGRLRASGA